MSDVILYRGGTPVHQFPNCDGSSQFAPPFPHRVAYEYATGEFTLGDKVDPAQRVYQQVEFDDANPKVGDIIQLLVVPEDHTLNSLFVAVDEADGKLAGAAFAPVALLYDRATGKYETLNILDGLFENVALDATMSAFAPIQVSQDIKIPQQTVGSTVIPEQTVSTNSAAPYFVARNKSLVLGYQVKSVPTDSSVSISDMTGVLTMVAKVSGFDCPTRM